MTPSDARTIPDIADNTRTPKASERIARALVNYIVDHDLAEGTMLPVERDLVELFNVGRSTLREALRLLESRGVITIRPGRLGGPVVRRPRPEDLGESLTLLLQFERSSLNDVMEARQAIEPAITALAAERITEERLDELDRSVRRMAENLGDRELFLEENRRFHDLIAEASESNVLRVFALALKALADGDSVGMDPTPTQRKSVVNAHRKIVEAMRESKEQARESMARHLSDAAKTWRRHHGRTLDQPIRWLEQ